MIFSGGHLVQKTVFKWLLIPVDGRKSGSQFEVGSFHPITFKVLAPCQVVVWWDFWTHQVRKFCYLFCFLKKESPAQKILPPSLECLAFRRWQLPWHDELVVVMQREVVSWQRKWKTDSFVYTKTLFHFKGWSFRNLSNSQIFLESIVNQ